MDLFKKELVELTRRLLESIDRRDWPSYEALCDPGLTCIEPESDGEMVAGLDFHRFYFELERRSKAVFSTICAPSVWALGADGAAIAYVRLIQHADSEGNAQTQRFSETRVWRRGEGGWKHVHFHRSAVAQTAKSS